MDTKEAIEEVGQVFWVKYGKFGNEKADNVIGLLKRGEKFEQTCNELIDVGKNTWSMWMELKLSSDNIPLKNRMDKLEQKFFPKPKGGG